MTYAEMLTELDDYNWDDGFDFPNKLLKQPECDLALALKIFYLGDGYGYFQVQVLSHNIGGAVDWLAFIGRLYADLQEGRYAKAAEPHPYRIPLNAAQKYSLRKAGFPAVFLEDLS